MFCLANGLKCLHGDPQSPCCKSAFGQALQLPSSYFPEVWVKMGVIPEAESPGTGKLSMDMCDSTPVLPRS